MESEAAHPSGTTITQLCERLRDVEDDLRESSVEGVGTEWPPNIDVDRAIRAIESVRAELAALAGEGTSSGAPLDEAVEQERIQQAISEVSSDEFDVQG